MQNEKAKKSENTEKSEAEKSEPVVPQSMKTLRREMSEVVRSVRLFIADCESENLSSEVVRQFRTILETYLTTISGKKGDETNVRSATKKAVLDLNQLDEKTDHELIETEERDKLYEFLSHGGDYVGFDMHEEIEQWREW